MEMKDHILDDLSQLYAQDKLTVEDYERRVSAVMATNSNEEAKLVNMDILAPGRYDSPTTRPNSNYGLGNTDNVGGNSRELVAIFSSNDLKGYFKAPKSINAASIFGGIVIDLREAEIPAEGIFIEAAAIFGSIDIFLPENVSFEVEGTPIFGGVERPNHSGNPGGPHLKIRATAIFGSVDVKIISMR